MQITLTEKDALHEVVKQKYRQLLDLDEAWRTVSRESSPFETPDYS